MKFALTITTINEPNTIVKTLAEGAIRNKRNFISIEEIELVRAWVHDCYSVTGLHSAVLS